MNIEKALENIKQYYSKSSLTEEEEFLLIESMEFVVNNRGITHDYLVLGGWYYEHKQFGLALEYYEMALDKKMNKDDMRSAFNCLGYIYYYGRVDKPDYEKAFKYFSMAANAGSIQATYKVADMYRNGYYVTKDYDKYANIIKDLYPKIKDTRFVFEPLPEISSRLAKIYIKENKIEEAEKLLRKAKWFQAQRLCYTDFFGDLTIMKFIILDLYSISDFDEDIVDLFDMYYVLQQEHQVMFEYNDKQYMIESILKDNKIYISYNGLNYEDIDDFFARATLDNAKLSTKNLQIDYMEILL